MKELEYTTQSVPKDKRFCTICGKVKRLHYFEGDSTHCSACCEQMLHTHVHWWGVAVVLAVLLVAAAAVILSVHAVPYSLSLLRADAALRDDRLSDANEAYAAALSDASAHNKALLAFGKKDDNGETPAASWTFFEAGTRTWTNYLQTYAALYSEYEAATLAQSSLDADAAASIPLIAQLGEAKTAYEETEAFMDELSQKYLDTPGDEVSLDDLIAEMSAFADASDSRYVKGYIEYYKATATQYFNKDDPAAAIPYYEKMLEYVPYEFMTVYAAEGKAAAAAGAYDVAIEAYEKILERNRNYTSAYYNIAEAAFLSGDTAKAEEALSHFDEGDSRRLQMELRYAMRSGDLDKAVQVRDKARSLLKTQADQIFNRMLAEQQIAQNDAQKLLDYVDYAMFDAALSLVQGDTDAAFKTAYEEAFNYAYYYAYISGDSGSMTQQLINMATLCASLKKNDEALGTVAQVGECDSTTQQVIDGKMTVRDIFVEGKADIL